MPKQSKAVGGGQGTSSQWLPRKQHQTGMISKSSSHGPRNPVQAPVSEFSKAFFSGKIKDRSTKESIKAAEEMHYLQRAARDPQASVIDSKVYCFVFMDYQGYIDALRSVFFVVVVVYARDERSTSRSLTRPRRVPRSLARCLQTWSRGCWRRRG